MENTNETVSKNIFQLNKIPIMGFIFMLAGPTIMMIAGFITSKLGDMHRIAANITAWTAVIIPGIGFFISAVYLSKWKTIGKLGRALAIVTVIMCNPIFYLWYVGICMVMSSTLAGLSWM